MTLSATKADTGTAFTSAAIAVSVVIPCLNEACSIASCIDKAFAAFRHNAINGEVVVADNGSTDGSVEIARHHGARVVHVELKGYGSALRRGIELSQGDFIIVGDADDTYDFSEIPKFVEKWNAGYEFVIGDRFGGDIKPGAMPWHHRYIGTPIMSAIANAMFGTGVRDINCGMRAFTRELAERIDFRTTGMEFASESLIKAAKMRARIAEVPITLWPDRRNRPPHLRSFRDGWRHLRFMLLCAPNWLFLAPGTVLFVVGLALVLWLLPGPRIVGRVVIDIHTMLFGMVFALLGADIVAIGMFAKVYSYTEKFSRHQLSLELWLRRVKLEHGLLAGAAMTVLGAAGIIWLLAEWIASDLGPFHHIRAVIFFGLWLCLGVHVIFSSFFLSMLGISRGTYIGDYDKE